MPSFPLAVCVFGPLLASTAWAAQHDVHFLPAGVVYPEFAGAVLSNPGALALNAGSKVIQALVAPPILGSTGSTYTAQAAAVFGPVGLGAGFSRGTTSQSGQSTQALSFGGGVRAMSSLSLGLAYVMPMGDTTASGTSTGSSLNLGMSIGQGHGINFAAVLNSLISSPSVGLGIGFNEAKKYSLEANLALPSFSTGLWSEGSGYTFGLAGTIQLTTFGMSFKTNYTYIHTSIDLGPTALVLLHEVAALMNLGSHIHLTLRANSASVLTLGLALGF